MLMYLCCMHMQWIYPHRATKKNVGMLPILWDRKKEVLRNYHKVVEAGTGPSPGFKCADF